MEQQAQPKASNPPTGISRDDEWEGVRRWFKRTGTPMTRENYLDFVHLGDPPPDEDIEEGDLPPEIRRNPDQDAAPAEPDIDKYTGKPSVKTPVAILGVRG